MYKILFVFSILSLYACHSSKITTTYWPNGNIKTKAHQNSKKVLDGNFYQWDSLGRSLVEGNYIQGEKNGTWKSIKFASFAKIIHIDEYLLGKKVAHYESWYFIEDTSQQRIKAGWRIENQHDTLQYRMAFNAQGTLTDSCHRHQLNESCFIFDNNGTLRTNSIISPNAIQDKIYNAMGELQKEINYLPNQKKITTHYNSDGSISKKDTSSIWPNGQGNIGGLPISRNCNITKQKILHYPTKEQKVILDLQVASNGLVIKATPIETSSDSLAIQLAQECACEYWFYPKFKKGNVITKGRVSVQVGTP
ncbi:MAG: hypothetical protein GY810_15635 [Aureispira sp.]|nr:hypothetical protein [Aureispira sp.]